jgi:hypothetical protein
MEGHMISGVLVEYCLCKIGLVLLFGNNNMLTLIRAASLRCSDPHATQSVIWPQPSSALWYISCQAANAGTLAARQRGPWAPLCGSLSPGFTIEGITNNPNPELWRNLDLWISVIHPPQLQLSGGPGKACGCPPTSHLASFHSKLVLGNSLPIPIISQRLVIHLLIVFSPLPFGFQSLQLSFWRGSGCLYSSTLSFPLHKRRMDKYSPPLHSNWSVTRILWHTSGAGE